MLRLPGLFAIAMLVLSCARIQAAERPNIVFILTDDQAPWAMSVAGHPHLKTPHMDRLAREGAYLVNAFTTTPVCSPSRAGFMASRFGSEVGITDWINHRPEPDLGLDPKFVIWPEVLKASGYTTGLVGKWHLGQLDKFHPTTRGFDYFMGFRGGGTTPKDPVLEIDGEIKKREGFEVDLLTEAAIGFIERSHAKPFLLCLHFRSPHAAWLPMPEQDFAPYKDLDPKLPQPDFPKLDTVRAKKVTREYLGSVASVDRSVGRLLARLDELKLAENTLVIFTSDHGYNVGHNGLLHKGNAHWLLTDPPAGTANIPKGQRPNMYDTSLRVPCLVRWPGVIKPGTVVKRTVTQLDWFPTLVAAAGAKLPEQTIRGRSILPLLKGEKVEWNDELYAEYSTHHQSKTHMRAYRTPKWKLVRDLLNPGRDELYDLVDDPEETKNLIDSDTPEAKAAVEELHEKILAKMHELNDAVLGAAKKP
jgi:choline-sulfatase